MTQKNAEIISNEHYAVELIHRYAEDSLCYLALEDDKDLFFGKEIEGIIAYVSTSSVAVCIGDPICSKENIVRLIDEFKRYCKGKRLKICFCSISNSLASILDNQGFHISKYGEEALLKLKEYDMKGGKKLKLRQKFKRAEGSGIRVSEYNPNVNIDYELEMQIERLSAEWFSSKKSKMTFSVGNLHLDEPFGRRFFVSVDKHNSIQAVLMFSPFKTGKGYFLDVMRRSKTAIPGVIEHAIITVAMLLTNEGVEFLSLGLAPLSGIHSKDNNTLEKCMHFVYRNLNFHYNFQSLHKFKKKFSPCVWQERFVAYEKNMSLFKIGYVLIKSRISKRYN